jgi:alkyl sulfatase BDS1-like metallo-beta-lactamase superfamily hydrolase
MRRVTQVALSAAAALGIALHAAAQDPPDQQIKVVRINSSIYMAPMTSNVYLVVTPGGNVVIDTAPARDAAEARDLLRAVSHAPVKYIILTHGHADHIGGIGLWKQPGTRIIAQRNYVELVNYVTRLEGFFAPRNAVAFNRPAAAAEPWAGNYAATVEPTILFDERYAFTLGGVRFELLSTPGETPDHLTVWLPAYRIAFIGDNYAGARMPEPVSFPNIYAIRGTKPRPALDWIKSIDTVLALKPAIVLNGHGDPIFGQAEIARRLTRYRDAIQYVHDETVKGMDAGKDVYTLMQEIRLPASYDLSEVFGKVSWSVRGIYDAYAGWFDGNPTSMYNLPASSVYPDLVELAGGPDAVVQLALAKLAAGKPVETLHLTDVVLAYDASNAAALKARIKALESLHERSENVIEDGWLQYGIRKAQEKLPAN